MPAPLLSICMPTHHGRAETLAEGLRSILGQLTPEIEICITDNASADGTEQMVRELQSQHPDAIRYLRNARDLGGPSNIRASVAVASGTWCWLLSSDDALEQGALSAAVELIARHPHASGFTLGWQPYDRAMARRLPGDWSVQPWNAGASERRFDNTAELIGECGPLFDYISIHVFRRELWLDADAAGQKSGPDTIYPTTSALGRISVQRPDWVWSPVSAVMTRADNHALMAGGRMDPARLRAVSFDDQRCVWRAILDDRELERRLMRKWVDVFAYPLALRGDVRNPATRVRGQLRLMWSLARALHRSQWFWRTALPVLAVPAPLARAWPTLTATVRPSKPLRPDDCRVQLRVELPSELASGTVSILPCAVRNLGSRPLRSSLPNPVHLGYRWFDREGRQMVLDGDRVLLDPGLRPGAQRRYDLRLTAPAQPGQYLLRVSAVQELVAWFDDVAPDNGRSARVSVTGR